MNPKQTKKAIEVLQKTLKENFGKRCKTVYIDCHVCTAYRLWDYLEWFKDLLDEKMGKYISK